MSKEKKPNPHGGHRQRKKEQFLTKGLDGFSEHEVLEFMLYYAIPHKDTNELAHDLIDRFGSLWEALDADYEELLKIKGIGENAASMICFFRMLAAAYFLSKGKAELRTKIFNTESLKNFCHALFINSDSEEVHCLFFNNSLELLGCEKINTGTITAVSLPYREITKLAFKFNSSRIAIAHNHPTGSCLPSNNDIKATVELSDMLGKIEMELIDHVIMGRDGILSIRENGLASDLWE